MTLLSVSTGISSNVEPLFRIVRGRNTCSYCNQLGTFVWSIYLHVYIYILASLFTAVQTEHRLWVDCSFRGHAILHWCRQIYVYGRLVH